MAVSRDCDGCRRVFHQLRLSLLLIDKSCFVVSEFFQRSVVYDVDICPVSFSYNVDMCQTHYVRKP